MPSLLFEIIAWLASIFFFLKKRNILVLYFMLFLTLTVLVEGTSYIMLWTAYQNTRLKLTMYNVFFVVEFVFYTYIFYLHFKKQSFRKIALLFIPLFFFFAMSNMLFLQGLTRTFNSYTTLLGSFFMVLFCCFYFYESIQPDQIDNQLSKQPIFWISSGLLIFYLGSVIVNALFEYLRNNSLQGQGMRIYSTIIHFLNVVLYSSFCIAFYLWPDRRKTYSSVSS